MKQLVPIDLKEIVDSVKAEGKSRRVLWQDSESIAFLSSGRKERRDFHIDPADEVTLQLTGVPTSLTAPPSSSPASRALYGMLIAEGKADIFLTYCTNAREAQAQNPGQ